MFSLTDYFFNMFYNDPLMLMVQLIIVPGCAIAGLVVLHDWYVNRKKKQVGPTVN